MNFKYEGKSCIYCQASASLFSSQMLIKNKETKKLKVLYESLNKSFVKNSKFKEKLEQIFGNYK